MNLARFDAVNFFAKRTYAIMTKPFSRLLPLLAVIAGQACSPSRTIGQNTVQSPIQMAANDLLQQPGLLSAQVGVCLYDPATSTYLYNYQGDKYFIPASNTKLFSLYAGLKYLGDSLPGVWYRETDTALFVVPCGDPTLLHPAFSSQPVVELLKKAGRNIYLIDDNWQDRASGRGWAWDDYNDDYAAERSPLPVYGNVIRWVQEGKKATAPDAQFDASPSFYSIPEVNWDVRFTTDTTKKAFSVQRDLNNNVFNITEGREKYKEQDVPFITDGASSAALLLKDTIGRSISIRHQLPASFMQQPQLAAGPSDPGGLLSSRLFGFRLLRSQPTDSLFRPMMHNSDNFFAEQTLMMVSDQRLGVMNDARIIDTLLKSDLKDLPQKPNWVDGSGLSRNDLFTPQDFVWLLNKMKNEFGLERMKVILPTGGTGTLGNYYKQDSGYIFAKTGSLSGVVALSGYLVTKKDHVLIFSILVNNHNDPAVRRQIETLIHVIRDRY
jgi:serine-type D-Ala-D-Ala carboxypeptidase/endopeptidase (penicillin-binding protein 4)